MADLGISHTHADQYGSARKKQPTARSKFQLALNATLIAAAFIFVAAVVCGIVG